MEYQKVNLKNMTFEITRKCNLNCTHCMRGDAQNISLSKEIIDDTIPQINAILSLSFTGGEPMLVPEIIEYLADCIMNNNIYVGKVGFVCNGTILDERAIKTIQVFNKFGKYIMNLLMQYTGEPVSYIDFLNMHPEVYVATIVISVDNYHHNNVDEAKEYYMKYAEPWVKIYTYPEWISINQKTDEDFAPLANIGNAQKNNIGRNEVEYLTNQTVMKHRHVCKACHKIEILDNVIQCPIEITALGNICIEEESSYDLEDKFNMGNVKEISIFQALQNWQWEEPLLCKEIWLLMQLRTRVKTNETPKYNEGYNDIITAIMLKRDSLKRIHEIYPYLSYEDVVKASNADLNLNTKGRYNKIMSSAFPEDYSTDYVYDEAKEEKICEQMGIKNLFMMIGKKYTG